MTAAVTVREIETPSGLARAHVSVTRDRRPVGLAVLGHGAGGGVEAPDLMVVTGALTTIGWMVARVEQPYRVKGRRAPEAAPRLDAAWVAVVAALRQRRRALPLLVGGRSSGARVACRTASAVGADAVLALAFPLHPPGKPDRSRANGLLSVTVPTLVVQGERDPFGGPGDLPSGPAVAGVPGDHSLRQARDRVAGVLVWIEGIGLSSGVLHRL